MVQYQVFYLYSKLYDVLLRFAYTSQQVRRKPGREVVTFLLGNKRNKKIIMIILSI